MSQTPHITGPDSAEVIAGWSQRPFKATPDGRKNALTVDVEDYFQVEAFANRISRDQWDKYDCRVEDNVDRILDLFARNNATATFFTLGWVARKYPSMVRRIVASGHELASHGTMHFRAAAQSPADFLQDVTSAKSLLEDLGGVEVAGYRAPSFSITRDSLWIFDVLRDSGYRYSSSTYPIQHDLYGIPEAPRFAFHPIENSDFVEIPVTSMRMFNRNFPSGGGGYFRLLPYWFSRMSLNRVSRKENRSCMFYFHPWEIDPGQPRIKGAPFRTRARHYTNLGRMEKRLGKLLTAYAWDRIDNIYPIHPAQS